MFEILKDRDMELLIAGVLEILEKLGMICQNKEILQTLEIRGAEVDYEKGNVKFSRKLVQEFIAEIKKEDKTRWDEEIEGEDKQTLLSGYVPPLKSPNEFQAPSLPYIFHPLAPFFYDDAKREKRKGNKNDFISLTKLGDVLHPEHGVGHSLILSDVPSEIEPLEAAVLLLEYAHQPRGVYIQNVRQIPYLIEMEEIAEIKDPHWHWIANVSFATPLKLGKDIADRFVYMVKSGHYPAKVYTMGVSGVNLPVTTGGFIILTGAEIIALWLSARSLNPKIPLTGLLLSGIMDMKMGEVNFWGFDVLTSRLSAAEFIKKWTGVSVSPGIGEYSPAQLPGFYTTLEKAYLAMTIAAFTGYHPDLGIGHLEAGLAISPVQLLLDREFTKALKFLESPIINEETVGLGAILEVGFGVEKNYLAIEHTLKNFRSSIWEPEFLSRKGWDMRDEEKMLRKAREKVQQLISDYKKPEIDPDKILKMQNVIKKAKKELSS